MTKTIIYAVFARKMYAGDESIVCAYSTQHAADAFLDSVLAYGFKRPRITLDPMPAEKLLELVAQHPANLHEWESAHPAKEFAEGYTFKVRPIEFRSE